MTDWVDAFEDRDMQKHDEMTLSAALIFVGVLATVCVLGIAFMHYAGWLR